ncbi:MAG: AMP-binding protein, partial [Candidatus Helarchaeota archaeon]
MKVGTIPRGSARSFPDELALIFKDKRITYSDFWIQVNNLGDNLLKLGLQVGDRVALLLMNSLEYHYSYYAVPLVGGIATPFNYFMSDEELVYCVNYSKPKFLLYQPQFEAQVKQFKEKNDSIEHYISTEDVQSLITEPPAPQTRP